MTSRIRTLESLEIIGGSLCLDFANTINSRRKPEYDYLEKYSDLVNWAVKVEVLTTSQGKRLVSLAEQDDANTVKALHKAISLRELLYQLFSYLSKQSETPQETVTTFGNLYAEAISHCRFQKRGDTFVVDWITDSTLDAMLWPIIYSAGQLLLSEKLVRVKECPNCGWLFLDTSKNQTRRWCNMNTCGTRDKMRRYHLKLRD